MFVAGIDAGATKTVCQVADDRAHVLAEARGPGANLLALGEPGVEKLLRELIARALNEAAVDLSAVCVGMAGVDRPRESDLMRDLLLRIRPQARPLVVNDALIALEAGAPGRVPAVVIVAGTGSIVYGRDGRGRAARAGGWGYVLGDEGSGYWIGRQALRAVVREADRRGPPTKLTRRVLAHFAVTRADDLVRTIYHGGQQPAAIAALAREVQNAADEGDAVAHQIIDVASAELASAAVSVATRLDLADGVVILSGGVFKAVARLRDGVTTQLHHRWPAAAVEVLQVEPALGAVRLALRLLSGDAGVPVYVDAG